MWMKSEVINPQRGLIVEAVERVAAHYRSGQRIDMRSVTIVLPSAAASRRLLQRLVVHCEQLGCVLDPPTITTVGHLPELLYPSRRPFADDLMQIFAWAQALRESAADSLKAVLSEPPADDDEESWLDLATTLQTVHRELASEGLSMADVRDELGQGAGFDYRRWSALSDIQTRYLHRLDTLGYWDRQTARLYAVEHAECRLHGELVLIGAVDLNRTMRRMLDQIAAGVWIMKAGLPADSDGFDPQGCLDEAYWTNRAIGLETVERLIVESHEDQAAAALEFVSNAEGETTQDDLVVGVLDESLMPYLERLGERYAMTFASSAGTAIEREGLYRMLEQLLEWLASRTFRALAALARHPLVFDQVSAQLGRADWLGELDEYQTRYLPSLVTSADDGPLALRVAGMIDQWCEPVRGGELKRAGEWKEAWFHTLEQLLGDCLLDREGESASQLRVLESLRDAWVEVGMAPEELQPRLTAAAAQRWLLRRLARQRIVQEGRSDSLSVIGWLDLPWSDASHLVILAFNEGCVPTPEPLDPLLPNSLRRRLGVMHSARRYARDAYYLSLLVASQRRMRIVAGKRDPAGDPLVPSRLWFADDESLLVSRALEAFDRPATTYRIVEPIDAAPSSTSVESLLREDGSMWQLPWPDARRVPATLSPTDFQQYIACPYRFYLSRVCGLGNADDTSEELSAGQFGDIAHSVLAAFGKSELGGSQDASAIASLLERLLVGEVQRRIAREHLPAVDLQVEQLRRRLVMFAEHQARWAAEGWTIVAIEQPFEAMLRTGKNRRIKVRGRIDRIDRHADGTRVALLDYKTSDSGRDPEASHRDNGVWVNLQLPLYQWLVETGATSPPSGLDGAEEEGDDESRFDESGEPVEYSLGFILLGSAVDANQFSLATWSRPMIDEAIDVARATADQILEGIYWPPTELSERMREYDPFDRLLQLAWPVRAPDGDAAAADERAAPPESN
ncbi:MAG: PD-(D/E)XK nuclease family protein [Planctomycetales bacterium]|nr:PD-(D/E)XK nuclease family protein [Planctomycetales bacterium]